MNQEKLQEAYKRGFKVVEGFYEEIGDDKIFMAKEDAEFLKWKGIEYQKYFTNGEVTILADEEGLEKIINAQIKVIL